MKLKDWGAFALLALAWGSSFLWIKIAVQEIGPITLVAYRLLFGLLGPTDRRLEVLGCDAPTQTVENRGGRSKSICSPLLAGSLLFLDKTSRVWYT